MTMRNQKPRLVLYGTGQFGLYFVRLAVEKGWPIVAAFNRAGAKVGQDLGRLAGLERDLGVVVQDCETARYDTLEADIGVVTMTNSLSKNFTAHQRLMNAGLNVLCLGTESCYPQGSDPALAAEIDAIAKRNKVTFTGGGIWDMSRIWAGILLTGPCTEIKSLYHSSITNAGQAGKAQLEALGVGFTLEKFKEKGLYQNPTAVSYKTIPEHVLVALGYTVTNTRSYVEPVVFDAPIDCPLLERVIPAGECVGTRIVGEIETKQGATAKAEIELRLFQKGEVEHMFWSVDGKPVTRVRTEREGAIHTTCACLLNRVSDVIAAPPGIVLISQMGPMKHSALIG